MRLLRKFFGLIFWCVWRAYCVTSLVTWNVAVVLAIFVYRRRDAADKRLSRHIAGDLAEARLELAVGRERLQETRERWEKERRIMIEDHMRELDCLHGDLAIRDKHIGGLTAVIARDRERVEKELAWFSREKQDAIGGAGVGSADG